MIDAMFLPPTVHYVVGTAALIGTGGLMLLSIWLWLKKKPLNALAKLLLIACQLVIMLQTLLGIKLLDQGLGILQLYIHYIGGLAPLLFFILLYWFPARLPQRQTFWTMLASVSAFAFVAMTYFIGGQFVRRGTLVASENVMPIVANTPAAANRVTVELSTRGDQMYFDQEKLEVPAGSQVTLRFKNAASPTGMVHNAVIVKPGTADAVGRDAIASNNPATWLKPNDDRVIAATKLIKGGDVSEVTFDAPPPGSYPIICTFPGHHTLMHATLVVK